MSQKSAPAATPTKKSSKPTLSQQALDDEAELQAYLITTHKPLSSKTLISQGQKQVFAEAEKMTPAQVEEEVKKTKRAKGLAEEVEVPPSQYKYKLDPAQQKSFLKNLSANEQKVVPADIKANLDILVNTIPKGPQRPSAAYFQYAQDLREKLKQQGVSLGVVEFSARVKVEWEKASPKDQAKYQSKYEKDAAAHKITLANYKLLLEIQQNAVAFYASKLKNIVVKSPQDIAKDEKEALENHGVKWRAHIPESLMKKMVAGVPNFDLKPSIDFCRTLSAAAEAYVVYLGQQTALRTVRMGKKTVQGVVLKATAGDLPQVAVVGHFPSFVNLQIDEKTMEKIKTKTSKKGDKTTDVDAKQPKLKLVAASKGVTSSAFDMDDTDAALVKSKSKKTASTPSKGKSVTELLSDDEDATTTPTKGKKSGALPSQTKKDTALKSMLDKSSAKAKADPSAAAKAKQMDDEDMSVVATPSKAKKASMKKNKKDDKQDPLYIPEDVTGVDANLLAKLKKEKVQYDNVMEITAPNGDVNYIDGESEELEVAVVNKYLAFKNKVRAIQSKSPSFVAAQIAVVKGKNSKPPTTYADSDDENKPKTAQKRKAQQQAVDEDGDDDVVVVTAQVSKKQKKQDKEDKQVVLPAAKKGSKK